METEPDYLQLEAPPPAYSEQEFDQKVSLATAISALTPVVDEEGWEHYDPRAFEDTTANPSPIGVGQPATTSSSSNSGSFPSKGNYAEKSDFNALPSINPLRIEKKSQVKSSGHEHAAGSAISKSKNDMEWTADGNSATAMYSTSPNGYVGHHEGQGHYTASSVNDDLDKLQHYKPATFQEVNNMDFDPAILYSSFPQTPQPENQLPLVDPYQPQPPMPMYTPERAITGNYPPVLSNPNSYSISQPDTYRRSLPPTPTLPRHQIFLEERPVTSYQPIQAPVLKFDPAMAYGKTSVSSPMHAKAPVISKPEVYDPHSLYSSAVSSQLGPLRGIQRQYPSTPPHNQKQYPNQTVQQSIQYSRPSPQFLDTSHTPVRNQPYTHATAGLRPDSTYFASNSPCASTTSVNRYF